jgi:hypothetical protein
MLPSDAAMHYFGNKRRKVFLSLNRNDMKATIFPFLVGFCLKKTSVNTANIYGVNHRSLCTYVLQDYVHCTASQH